MNIFVEENAEEPVEELVNEPATSKYGELSKDSNIIICYTSYYRYIFISLLHLRGFRTMIVTYEDNPHNDVLVVSYGNSQNITIIHSGDRVKIEKDQITIL